MSSHFHHRCRILIGFLACFWAAEGNTRLVRRARSPQSGGKRTPGLTLDGDDPLSLSFLSLSLSASCLASSQSTIKMLIARLAAESCFIKCRQERAGSAEIQPCYAAVIHLHVQAHEALRDLQSPSHLHVTWTESASDSHLSFSKSSGSNYGLKVPDSEAFPDVTLFSLQYL